VEVVLGRVALDAIFDAAVTVRNEVSPMVFLKRKILCRRGRRRSESTTSTFLPSW